MLFKKFIWQYFVLSATLIATISPSQAETTKTTESEPESSPLTEVTNTPQSYALEGNITLSEIPSLERLKLAEMAPDSSNPNTEDTPEPSSSDESQPKAAEGESKRWHFLIEPYIYLPITIYGDSSVGSVTKEIDLGFDQIKRTIKDDLNFAFLANLQAWTPNYHVGILTNVDYLSTSDEDTFTRTVRHPRLEKFVPSQLKTSVDTDLWSVDLAAAYRFYDQSKVNPKEVSTEFDLGKLVFDVFGGLNITSISNDLDLSTNLGGKASFDNGATVVSPLLGAHLRINATPKLAVVTEASVSGFGIDGLTKWGALGGIDWMFSGNTSVGLGYRFGHTSYNSDLDNDKDFGVTVNNNGPYLSFSFRF